MRIIVVGGSNSIKRQGWVAHLAAALPQAEIVNLSVGAANSLMGYFRLRGVEDLGPQDAVLWEYALNDENQMQTGRPLDVAKALAYVERTLQVAAERQARFLPVILRPRHFANGEEDSPYRAALTALFAAYDIVPVNPYADYAAAHDGAEVPEADYSDRLHLREDGEVVKLAALSCTARLQAGVAPPKLARRQPERPRPPLSEALAVFRLEGPPAEEFENSLTRQLLWKPGPQNGVIFRPAAGQWRIVALMIVAASERAHIGVQAGPDALFIPASHQKRDFTKPILRMNDISDRAALVVSPDQPLQLLGWETPGKVRQRGPALAPLPERCGLTGLLLERLAEAPSRG